MYNIFDVIVSDCSHDSVLFKLYAQRLALHLVVLSLIFSLAAKQLSLFCSTPKLIQSFRKVFVKTLKDLYVFDWFQELKLLLTPLLCPSVIRGLQFDPRFFLKF